MSTEPIETQRNSNSLKTILWKIVEGAILAAIVAGFSFLGTMHANNLSISIDYQKSLNSFNAARRDGEVKRSLEEIEGFINRFEELKSEVNIILKNLTKSNLVLAEDFYSPSMNMGNFSISDEDLSKKINLLRKKIIPKLQNHHKRLTKTDLPPKKWTQRRDGFSIKASSKTGGVQWKGKKEKRSDLTGNLRFPQSRWSQKAVIRPQRWQGAWESMRGGFISGRSNLAIPGIRPLLAKAI